MNFLRFLIKWKYPLLLGFLLSLLYIHFFENRATVELEIQVPQKTWFTLYWTADGKGYSEWRMARVRVSPKQQYYRFYLTDIRDIEKLRIDPHMFEGEIVLKKLLITQRGQKDIECIADTVPLQPLSHIDSLQWKDDGLHVSSTGNDPQLEYTVALHDGIFVSWLLLFRIVAIFSFTFLFFSFSRNFHREEQFVPLFLVAVFTLVVVMAAISRENVHPDEYVHLDAAEYYENHSLPPKVDDPEIRDTFSVYGVSRLNNYELPYFFIGKLSVMLRAFHLPEYFNLRVFNILLFAVLLLYILKNPAARMLTAPLLISPQIWYVFSYCNSDAFGIVVSFLVACQFVLPGSMLNSYLLGKYPEKRKLPILLLGCLVGALFLLKKNYLFFTIFIAGYGLWRMLLLVEPAKRRLYCKRMIILGCLGLSMAGLRIGAGYAVNGMDMASRKAQVQEQLADYAYKPSTPLEEKHPFLYRKARGDSLKKIVVMDRWFEKTFRSAFGVYGYFTVSGVDIYYSLVRIVGGALFLLLCAALIIRGGPAGILLFALFVTCGGALIGASLYHSWTMDYQTQGRYLFPLIPMFCVLLYHTRTLMQGSLYKLLLTSLFVLSVYSFVFVALLKLPKIV